MNRDNSRQPDARLMRLLGGTELAQLRQRLRRHFERHGGQAGRALQLTNLTPVEQEALALLTGRPPRSARSMRVDIGQLDASLRAAGVADSLRAAVELLDGPIEDRAALRQARLLRWAQITSAERCHPALRLWLQAPAAAALLKRLARGDHSAAGQLLERANSVMRRLPVSGITRAQLAAETFGNAHALDNGHPTATLILAALRQEGRTDDAAAAQEENGETLKAPERARGNLGARRRTCKRAGAASALLELAAAISCVDRLPTGGPALSLAARSAPHPTGVASRWRADLRL